MTLGYSEVSRGKLEVRHGLQDTVSGSVRGIIKLDMQFLIPNPSSIRPS